MDSSTNLSPVDRGLSSTKEKRQAPYPNSEMEYPHYRQEPQPQMFYPGYQRNGQYSPNHEDDQNKPRVRVHVETEKKDFIQHTKPDEEMTMNKRQLFGIASLISPVQSVKTPLVRTAKQSNQHMKSEVPQQRIARAEPIEVPIRAEEHHGAVAKIFHITEDGETKKSTIQRMQKREADDTNHAQSPVKRQFVFNSEPEVVRATVHEKGGHEPDNNPIGNLIKLIAGQNSKNILGLNSKSFDVFPGPMPTGGEKSAWNMQSSEGARAGGMGLPRRNPYAERDSRKMADLYSKAGIAMNQARQQRAEAAKEEANEEANKEANEESERETLQAREAALVANQAAIAARQQRMQQEKETEKEGMMEREQEFEHEKARELAYLGANQQQQQHQPIEDDNQDMMPFQHVQRQAMHTPFMQENEPEMQENEPAYPQTFHQPMQEDDDFAHGQMRMAIPMPMNGYGYQNAASFGPMPMMRPTMGQFFMPTPSMFMNMMPRAPVVTYPESEDPMMKQHVQRSMTAHTNEQFSPQQMPHYSSHDHYHKPRYHSPTESPYHPDDAGFPGEDEDDEKPEVHVHIQTEKSNIPQRVSSNKDKIKNNNKATITTS